MSCRSGAAKRALSKQKNEAALKGQPKLCFSPPGRAVRVQAVQQLSPDPPNEVDVQSDSELLSPSTSVSPPAPAPSQTFRLQAPGSARRVEPEIESDSDSCHEIEADTAPELSSSSTPVNCHHDIGLLPENPTMGEIDNFVRNASAGQRLPRSFPVDKKNEKFPLSVLQHQLQNGEQVERSFLYWSPSKQALFCGPCRLFPDSAVRVPTSSLASPGLILHANLPSLSKVQRYKLNQIELLILYSFY